MKHKLIYNIFKKDIGNIIIKYNISINSDIKKNLIKSINNWHTSYHLCYKDQYFSYPPKGSFIQYYFKFKW